MLRGAQNLYTTQTQNFGSRLLLSHNRMERASSSFKSENSKFKVGSSNYATQYNNLYTQRTKKMKDDLTKLVLEKWGNGCQLADKIIDTESNTGDNEEGKDPAGLAIIGVLFKEMKKRDSVLEKFKDGTGQALVRVNWTTNITDKEDTVLLEDTSGRAALGGPIIEKEISKLVGGVVMAARVWRLPSVKDK